MNQEKLIQIKNLKTFFNTEAGTAKAVNDVSFDIYKGEVLGIVASLVQENLLHQCPLIALFQTLLERLLMAK